ncbi:uncharacterized protein LOC144494154 [Mustelus asterias]
MGTQTQSSNICRVDRDTVTTPQIIDVTEMSPPLVTSCSAVTDAICSVTQTASSANTSSARLVEPLPAETECVNVVLPTEINPAACLLTVSAAMEHDENEPPGKCKQLEIVREDRDSPTPDKSVASKPCSIQESSFPISFPRVFGPPPSHRANSSTVLTMITIPASSRTGVTTTIANDPNQSTCQEAYHFSSVTNT